MTPMPFPERQQDLVRLAHLFLSPLMREVEGLGLNISRYDVDHLCWRTATNETYAQAKYRMSAFANLLSEVEINGRLIASYHLHTPIVFENQSINTLEIPSPKAEKAYDEGFEHMEVVTDVPFQELAAGLGYTASLKRPSVLNPEFPIDLRSGTVKFHHIALADVITMEKQQDVMAALRHLALFEKLHNYTPHLSGSRLLGLHLPDSDVDILCKADDFAAFKRDVTMVLQGVAVSWRETQKYGVPSLVGEFSSEGLNFQLFAQGIDPCRQISNLHYLIESRLLKLFGKKLHIAVLGLKKMGVATEPAFAKALGLDGDPYQRLLELQRLSEHDLRTALFSSFVDFS